MPGSSPVERLRMQAFSRRFLTAGFPSPILRALTFLLSDLLTSLTSQFEKRLPDLRALPNLPFSMIRVRKQDRQGGFGGTGDQRERSQGEIREVRRSERRTVRSPEAPEDLNDEYPKSNSKNYTSRTLRTSCKRYLPVRKISGTTITISGLRFATVFLSHEVVSAGDRHAKLLILCKSMIVPHLLDMHRWSSGYDISLPS